MDMRSDRYRGGGWLVAMTLLLACLLPGIAAAVEPVGRVISVSGDVIAVREAESSRSLDRGDSVYEGDEIRTGSGGNTQIRFIDGGLFDLDPGTRFAVDRYRSGDEQSGGSALMSFLRGALRTITGAIGDRTEDTYQLQTPTATIGVRGTGYALYYCDADCAGTFGGEPGLYGRVDDGTVRVNTPRGSGDFSVGSFFFVPAGGTPRAILQPPPGILDGENEGGVDVGDIAEIVQLIAPGGDTGEPIFEAGDLFRIGGSVAAAGTIGRSGPFSGAQLFDGGAFATNAQGDVTGVTFASGLDVRVDGAQLLEAGSFPALNVGWGRWNGSFLVNGSPASGNLAFTVTDNFTDPAMLGGMNGLINYTLAGGLSGGGPSAFDQSGGIWTVSTLSLLVDFNKTGVDLNQFSLINAGQAFVDFFGSDVNGRLLDLAGNRLRLDLNGTGGTGTISGKFVGAAADGMIVTFTVNNPNPSAGPITGTKVLEQGLPPG